MFGHNRQNCHLLTRYGSDEPIFPYRYAMTHWQRHCVLNEKWIAARGAGHTVPEPKIEDFIKKTPFEQACDNTCKVTHADDCCICMETLGEKNTATTACGHQFHFGCLVQNTNRSDKCPMCRAIIRPGISKLPMILPNIETRQQLAERSVLSETFYSRIYDLLYVGNNGPTDLELGIIKLTYDSILSNAETMLGGIRRTNA
tara:strand:+ start:893 stop:1495 length:603 start_codon:yes stop_codon:yes gene_type:complete